MVINKILQLFICAKNDIGNISDFLYTILYAHDIWVLLYGKQYMYNNLVKLLNLELEKQNWLRSNKLSLNVQKNLLHNYVPYVQN